MLRHPSIGPGHAGRCIGQTDVPAVQVPGQLLEQLQEQVDLQQVQLIVTSPLIRARHFAHYLAGQLHLPLTIDPRLIERHFGIWEGQHWEAIYKQSGRLMEHLIDQPNTFAPPGGETTFQLRDRIVQWYEHLSAQQHLLAVSHGGPIAALCGTLANRPVAEWFDLMPAHGRTVCLPLGLQINRQ